MTITEHWEEVTHVPIIEASKAKNITRHSPVSDSPPCRAKLKKRETNFIKLHHRRLLQLAMPELKQLLSKLAAGSEQVARPLLVSAWVLNHILTPLARMLAIRRQIEPFYFYISLDYS